jgi:hypothetical protein
MKALKEKRAYRRCEYKVPVTCAFFNSDRFYRGQAINHSDEGIYFESNYPFKPGAIIYIRVEGYSHEGLLSGICCCGGMRMLSVAEVKWCKEFTEAADSYFGVGLKYYPPEV